MPHYTVACIIQARSNSKRLPNKWRLQLGDLMVVDRVVEAALNAKKTNIVVVVVPFLDDPLIKHLANKGYNIFTGSEDNVLDRFYQCAKLLQPKHIVRLTADCPLLTPEIIDETIMRHLLSGADYTANRLDSDGYPDGFDVEAFTYDMLRDAWAHAKKDETEHVTTYIKRAARHLCQVVRPKNLDPYVETKLSLDTYEDYGRIIGWREEMLWR